MEFFSALPGWGQEILMAAITLVASIIGVLKYIKTEGVSSDTSTLSHQIIRDLISSISNFQDIVEREHRKTQRNVTDLKSSLDDLNDTLLRHNDMTLKLTRTMKEELLSEK
jgi:hypothetical protein